jgi:hypothetical protein
MAARRRRRKLGGSLHGYAAGRRWSRKKLGGSLLGCHGRPAALAAGEGALCGAARGLQSAEREREREREREEDGDWVSWGTVAPSDSL